MGCGRAKGGPVFKAPCLCMAGRGPERSKDDARGRFFFISFSLLLGVGMGAGDELVIDLWGTAFGPKRATGGGRVETNQDWPFLPRRASSVCRGTWEEAGEGWRANAVGVGNELVIATPAPPAAAEAVAHLHSPHRPHPPHH